MTTSFDGPSFGGNQEGLRARQYGDGRCGENLDWLLGAQGLQRQVGRSPEVSQALIAKVLERDIIPRLLLVHREPDGQPAPAEPSRSDTPYFGGSEAFVQLVLSSDTAKLVGHVRALIDRGVDLKRIYLDLLAPVARKLGELWEADRCTFVDVTLGMSRLHQVLREISRSDGEGFKPSNIRRSVYLAPSPGEQHTFGLSIIGEFFLHGGWDMASDHTASGATVLETVANHSIDVIGFTLGCEERIDPLVDLIKRTRVASQNQNIAIIVGGRLFHDHPDFASRVVGATVIADGVNAVQAAEQLTSRPSEAIAMLREGGARTNTFRARPKTEVPFSGTQEKGMSRAKSQRGNA